MRTVRRIAVSLGVGFVLFAVAVGVVRAQRAAADAKFLEAAQLDEILLNVGDIERRALVHVPKEHDGRSALPVVLMLHGAGGTAIAAAKETGWVTTSDAERILIVFPEATRPDAAQPPRFGRNNHTWNDGSGRFHSGERNVADVEFISALLDHLESQYSVDKDRIFVTGFSNGASMSFRVGIELSDRVAAIAPVAGALWIKEPKAAYPVSMLYITGTNDPLNPMAGGQPKMANGADFKDAPDQRKPPVIDNVKTWAAMLECRLEPKPVPNTPAGVTTMVYSGGRHGAVTHFTTVDGQGHIWPGGKNFLPELIVGKATDTLNATDAIWKFFMSHARTRPDKP